MGQAGYIRVDGHGVMRVADTHVMLDSIIAAFERGHSPETIRSQFPSLLLEQVYGAIAYYLSHRAEVDEYLRRQGALWQQWQAQAGQRPSAALERLRNQQATSAGGKP